MAIVGFEQDPLAPYGAGWFHADNGQKIYEHLPDIASQFAPPPQPDQRLAMGDPTGGTGGAPGYGQDPTAGAGGAQPTPPPSVSDVGPSMAPTAAAQAPAGAPGAPPPMLARPPGPAPSQGQPEVPIDPQQAALQAYVNAPVRSGSTPGGYRPKSEEVTREGGAPVAPEDWQAIKDANQGIVEAKTAADRLTVNRANQQSLEAEAAMPQLVAKRNEANAQYEAQRATARNDLAKVQAMVQATSEKHVDPQRLFKERGVVGNVFAAIAQAMAGYGTPGLAQKIAADAINADVAAQQSDVENGRAGANNMLAIIQKQQDLTLPQAAEALKMAQLSVVNNELQRWGGVKLSQDAAIQHQQWLADNQKAFLESSRKIYNDSFGKETVKKALSYQAPNSGGMAAPTEKQRQERLATIGKAQEVGAMPDTSRAAREFEAKKKNDPSEAKRQDQLNSIDSAMENARELNKLYEQKTPLSPAQRGRLRYFQGVAPMEAHKALTGMSRFSDQEGQRYKEAYGDIGESSDLTGRRQAALGALLEEFARKKAQLKGGGGGATEEHPDIENVE